MSSPGDGTPTIQQALAAVMGDVQAVRKEGYNANQKYNFRGVDAVVNAVGPALREHGVIVLPLAESAEYESYTSKGGGAMKGCVVRVRFVFVGPAGDTLECCVYGESSDSGDKATPKAHSVAFRTALLEALCIPTDEADPDLTSHERAEEKPPTRRMKPSKAGPALPSATDMQYLAITSLIDDLSDKEKAALMAWWAERSMPSLKKRELSAAHADVVLAELERILEERPKGAPIEPESEAPVGVAGPTRTGGSAASGDGVIPGNNAASESPESASTAPSLPLAVGAYAPAHKTGDSPA